VKRCQFAVALWFAVFYDMHGNVAEWTSSVYREYGSMDVPDGERYVVRGGSFYDRPERCRAAGRTHYAPWHCVFNVGFRVVAD